MGIASLGLRNALHGASPIMISATLHLAATLPPCPPARNPLPYQQEPVMEFDWTPSVIREEVCYTQIDQEDGFIPIMHDPGLGVEVNEAVLERLCVHYQETKQPL